MIDEVVEVLNSLSLPFFYVKAPKDSELPCVIYADTGVRNVAKSTSHQIRQHSFTFYIYNPNEPTVIWDYLEQLDKALIDKGFLLGGKMDMQAEYSGDILIYFQSISYYKTIRELI